MIKLVFIFTLLSLLPYQIISQEFSFYKVGLKDESFVKALEGNDNIYYLLGQQNLERNETVPFLMKIDATGQMRKEFYLDSIAGIANFRDIIWSPEGDLIAVGALKRSTDKHLCPTIAKFNTDLKLLWIRTYPLSNSDGEFFKIRLKEDKTAYYACGNSGDNTSSVYKSLVTSFNLQGDTVMFTQFSWGNTLLISYDILETSDGRFLLNVHDANIPGFPYNQNGSNKLVLLNQSSLVDTVIELQGQGMPASNKMPITGNSKLEWIDSTNLYIQGVANNETDTDILDDDRDLGILILTYPDFIVDTSVAYGDMELWDYPAYHSPSFTDTSSIFQCVTHNFNIPYLFPSLNKSEIFVVKSNSKGIRQWEKRYSNGAHLLANGILSTQDGGALVYGSSYLHGYNGEEERDAYALKIGPNGEALITPAGIVSDLENFEFSLYPNPSHGIFNIVLPGHLGMTKVSIFNSLGAMVYSTSLQDVTKKIQTDLRPGIYSVVVKSEEHLFKKLLVIR